MRGRLARALTQCDSASPSPRADDVNGRHAQATLRAEETPLRRPFSPPTPPPGPPAPGTSGGETAPSAVGT